MPKALNFGSKKRLDIFMKYEYSTLKGFFLKKTIKTCLQDVNRPQLLKWRVEDFMQLV